MSNNKKKISFEMFFQDSVEHLALKLNSHKSKQVVCSIQPKHHFIDSIKADATPHKTRLSNS